MDVRPHLSQHERAEELPLITERARVVAVEPQDHNRVDEVERAVPALLRSYGYDALSTEVVDRQGEGVDWELLDRRLAAADPPAALDEEIGALADRYERPYPSLVSIRIRAKEHVDFVAGQYVTIRYDGVPRPYSVSCSPNDNSMELCVRCVPGGKLSSKLCTDIEVGDRVTIRGPNGDFVLEDPTDRDVVFAATGTGVAPLRSMIEYTFEEGRDVHEGRQRNVWLFLGAGWEDDLPYRDRFRELAAERDNFHFVPSLSRESLLTDWSGETAYVQNVLLRYVDESVVDAGSLPARIRRQLGASPATDVDARLHPGEMELYACGINAMVNSLVGTARDLDVPEGCIDAEGYG